MNQQFAFDPKLDFTIERFIDAPTRLVWEALTKPEHLKEWYMPKAWGRVADCEMDVRPGGIIRAGRCSSGRWRHATPENQRRTIRRRADVAGAPWVPARAAEASTPWRQRMDTGPVRAPGPPAFVFPELHARWRSTDAAPRLTPDG